MSDTPSFSNFNAALSLLNHVYFTPILGALVHRGVPDHLDNGPLAVADLAQLAEMDTLSLTRVLRALTAFGTFQEVSPGVFANNPVSDLFRNRPGGLRNCALFYSSDHFLKSASALGHSVVTGQSATNHVFGKSVWEHFRQHPEENEAFNRALAELRGDEHQQIADTYDWAGVNTVVDVGGGVGSLLVAILEKQPSIRGVLIEQPEVLCHADPVLSARGVRDRCELVGGSFFDPISAVGEVWAMCQVLHDWPDAECRTILQRCREAVRATDRLLVMEMLTVPCEPNVPVSLVDMVMLMYFGEARQRTIDEYKKLFDSTHFALTRILSTAGAFSIVEARPV
jgi:hypothetical protein